MNYYILFITLFNLVLLQKNKNKVVSQIIALNTNTKGVILMNELLSKYINKRVMIQVVGLGPVKGKVLSVNDDVVEIDLHPKKSSFFYNIKLISFVKAID